MASRGAGNDNATIETLRLWLANSEEEVARLRGIPNGVRRELARIEDPDVSIPLLRSYEGYIDQLKEEVQSVQEELKRKNQHLEAITSENRNATTSIVKAQAEKEEAIACLAVCQNENVELKQQLQLTQASLATARARAAASIASDNRSVDRAQAEARAAEEREALIARLQSELARQRQTADAAQSQLEAIQQNADFQRAAAESQEIQLELMKRENEDKGSEIARMRHKMMGALKLASDNHNAHLRLVEQKHSSVVQHLRDESNTKDITIAKMRAQLHQAELRGSRSTESDTMSPTAILATQMRQAQEIELRALYAEVAAATQARDDAIQRQEQSCQMHRLAMEEANRGFKKDLCSAQEQSSKYEGQLNAAQTALNRQQEVSRSLKEELRVAEGKILRLTGELGNVQASLDESKRQCSKLTVTVGESDADCERKIAEERRVAAGLQRQLDAAQRAITHQRESHTGELEEMRRQVDSLRLQHADVLGRLSHTQATVAEKQRALESLQQKVEWLQLALSSHKEEIHKFDQRVALSTQREEAVSKEFQKATLQVEQLTAEMARIARERDRLIEGRKLEGKAPRVATMAAGLMATVQRRR